MKRFFVLLLIVGVLGGAAYYYFFLYKAEKTATLWSVLPENSAVVIEAEDMSGFMGQLKEQGIWSKLKDLPYFFSIQEKANELDTVLANEGGLSAFFLNRKTLLSFYSNENSVDELFSIALTGADYDKFMVPIVKHYKNVDRAKTSIHKTQNIIELMFDDETVIYCTYLGGILQVSHEKPLIQSSIDLYQSVEKTSELEKKKAEFGKVFTAKSTNVFLSFDYVPGLIANFCDPQNKEWVKAMKSLLGASYMDLSVDEQSLFLSGYSNTDSKDNFLTIFKGQEPQKLDLKFYVPNNTALFYYWGFDNNHKFKKAITDYWQRNNKENLKDWLHIQEKTGVDIGGFYEWFSGEVGMSVLSPEEGEVHRLLFLGSRAPYQSSKELKKMAAALGNIDTKLFMGHELITIPVEELPEKTLGSLYNGFSESVAAIVGDYVVVSDDEPTLMRYIKDLEDEKVWGKSINKNHFLDQLPAQSNVMFLADVPQAWKIILNNLDEETKAIFKENEPQLKGFESVALQFANQDGSYYSSMFVKHGAHIIEKSKEVEVGIRDNVVFDTLLAIAPHVVRSHVDHSLEIFTQDVNNKVYFVNENGKVLWTKQLPERIISDVIQVDIFRNGKLQYLFATKKNIYALDRLGNMVEHFPFNPGDSVDIGTISVIDYDNNKKYRFAVSDTKGGVYLFNVKGEKLGEWTPRMFSGALAVPLQHIRISGKDCMIGLMESGKVDITNRRGESMKGFPLELKGTCSNPLFIKEGSSFESTIITTITDQGRLISFNLEGEIKNVTQFTVTGAQDQFQLCIDALGKDFVIFHRLGKQFSFLSANKGLLMDGTVKTPNTLIPQYYKFDKDNEVYLVTSPLDKATHIYYGTGKSMVETPIVNQFTVGLLYYKNANRYHLFKAAANNYQELSISPR